MNHTPQSQNEQILLSIFALLGVPRSLLDVGCGDGSMVRMARRMGVDAVGLDINAQPPNIQADLRQPINLGMRYDMVLCIEVAEHIEPEYEDALIKTIGNHAQINGRVVFSAAVPGQGGEGHVNLRQPIYWRDKLWNTGGHLSYQPELTTKLSLMMTMTAGSAANWLAPNLQVF